MGPECEAGELASRDHPLNHITNLSSVSMPASRTSFIIVSTLP